MYLRRYIDEEKRILEYRINIALINKYFKKEIRDS